MYIIVGYLLLYLSCVQSHHQINIHTDIYTLRLQSRTDIVYATMSLNIPLSSFRCRPHLLGCPECGHFPPFATLDKPTDWIAILHCSNDNCSINPTYYICRFCATKVLPGGRAIVERRYLYRHSRTKQHVETMTMLSNDETRNILKQPSSDPNPTDHSSVALPVDEEHFQPPSSHNFQMSPIRNFDLQDEYTTTAPSLSSPGTKERDQYGDNSSDVPSDDNGFLLGECPSDTDPSPTKILEHFPSNEDPTSNELAGPPKLTTFINHCKSENNFHVLFPPQSSPVKPTSSTKGAIPSDRNSVYFEYSHQLSLGPASIVSLSMNNGHRNKAPQVHPSAALWGILMTWLLSGLPKRKQEVVSVLLQFASEFSPPSGYQNLNLPHSSNEMTAMFTSGPKSILKNLPYPTITQLPDGHVYVSLVDIVRDLVGHGRHIESLCHNSASTHSKSVRGVEILDSSTVASPTGAPTYVLPIYLWRDGFDPFNVKRNKASAWSMFASIGTPQVAIHSTCNTYLSALGPSNISHNSVEQLLQSDLKILSSGKLKVYDGHSKTVVLVFAQIYSIQEDRPEKGSHTYTAAGNSNYHARFGYSGNVLSVKDKLPSCARCLEARLHNTVSIPGSCRECFDWSFDGLRYPVPRDYPTPSANVIDGTLRFHPITFQSLQLALETCHEQVSLGNWKIAQAKCYLSTEGICSDLASRLVANAVRCKKFFRQRDADIAKLSRMVDPLTPSQVVQKNGSLPNIRKNQLPLMFG